MMLGRGLEMLGRLGRFGRFGRLRLGRGTFGGKLYWEFMLFSEKLYLPRSC